VNHLDPRPRQSDSLAGAHPPDEEETKRHRWRKSDERKERAIGCWQATGDELSPHKRACRYQLQNCCQAEVETRSPTAMPIGLVSIDNLRFVATLVGTFQMGTSRDPFVIR
jgi:hypothetical protein